MLPYELVFLLSPELEEERVKARVDELTRWITERGGIVEATDLWGRRRLAYPIKRFSEGNYVMTHFQLEPKGLAELEAHLKVSEEVIRHLLVRRDK